MLKNQTVNHVSEHLSAICPVYTVGEGLIGKGRFPCRPVARDLHKRRDTVAGFPNMWQPSPPLRGPSLTSGGGLNDDFSYEL